VLPSFVLCPEDALHVLVALQADHPESPHIALVTDPERRGRLAIPFPPRLAEGELTIEKVAELLLEAAGGDRWDKPCLVLCSCRDRVGWEPTGDDVACWYRLRARCEEHEGVELLDWFLLSDEVGLSMSEVVGPGWPEC
jgi:hypothetical protein